MKKLILTLLTLASLTACKKDIVEPTNGFESNKNRLPKKSIERSNWYGGEHRTVIKEFTYNADGLLTKVTSHDSANASVISTLAEFTYSNGKMQTSKQLETNREIYNTYDENGLLTLTTYKKKNGDYRTFKCFYLYDEQNRIDSIKTVTENDSIAYLNIRYSKSISGEDSVILSPYTAYDWSNEFSILDYGFGYAIKNDSVTNVDKSQGSYKMHYTNKAYNYQREVMEFLLVDMGYNTMDDFPYSPVLKAWNKSYYPTLLNPLYNSGDKTYEYKFDDRDRLSTIKTSYYNGGFSKSPNNLIVNTTVIY